MTDDPWDGMFPLPEGFSLERQPLSEERKAELRSLFYSGRRGGLFKDSRGEFYSDEARHAYEARYGDLPSANRRSAKLIGKDHEMTALEGSSPVGDGRERDALEIVPVSDPPALQGYQVTYTPAGGDGVMFLFASTEDVANWLGAFLADEQVLFNMIRARMNTAFAGCTQQPLSSRGGFSPAPALELGVSA